VLKVARQCEFLLPSTLGTGIVSVMRLKLFLVGRPTSRTGLVRAMMVGLIAAASALLSSQAAPVGEQLKQHDLALTLRRIADGGPPGFYHGEVAERIEEEMRRHGGWITRTDLAAYEAKRRVPVRGKYRGFEVLSMSPPSSGGVVLLQMLNVLEGYDLAAAGWGSTTTVHWMAETMRRGFADRARFLGDPDFNESMPVERLLSTDYAAKLRGTIRNDGASTSAPDRFTWPPESPETTHLSVVARPRNTEALTLTIEESYGSGIVAPGTGFLLNNEMGDFTAHEFIPTWEDPLASLRHGVRVCDV